MVVVVDLEAVDPPAAARKPSGKGNPQLLSEKPKAEKRQPEKKEEKTKSGWVA